MKEHRIQSQRKVREAERMLYNAILTLQDADECRRFFHDLCTPAELEAMTDRWTVVGLLKSGLPYREIYSRTGISVTTVGRVARCLTDGNGGYEIARERLE